MSRMEIVAILVEFWLIIDTSTLLAIWVHLTFFSNFYWYHDTSRSVFHLYLRSAHCAKFFDQPFASFQTHNNIAECVVWWNETQWFLKLHINIFFFFDQPRQEKTFTTHRKQTVRIKNEKKRTSFFFTLKSIPTMVMYVKS